VSFYYYVSRVFDLVFCMLTSHVFIHAHKPCIKSKGSQFSISSLLFIRVHKPRIKSKDPQFNFSSLLFIRTHKLHIQNKGPQFRVSHYFSYVPTTMYKRQGVAYVYTHK
jgi:hypothetical protein